MPETASPEYLAKAEQLPEALARWRAADFLAIDTEFVREQTYFPQPCLVQVSDGTTCTCVDLLSLESLDELLDVLLMPDKPRVLHAASQDLEIFHHLGGRTPASLFDTQIAATLLGLGDQIGYAGLVKALCGVELDKSLSRTNWARRPLKPAEIAYAADDVRYLAELYPGIREQLSERGRLSWLEEDCAALADPARYVPRPEQAWKRLRGIARLAPQDQHVLAHLARWRELEAIRRDRPRKWILADEALYALAERHPRSMDELQLLKLLPPKTLDRHADALLACVAEGLKESGAPLAIDDRSDEKKKRQLRLLSDRLRAIANPLELPPSVLASRADLDTLMREGAAADIALLRGWRQALAGTTMLDLRENLVSETH